PRSSPCWNGPSAPPWLGPLRLRAAVRPTSPGWPDERLPRPAPGGRGDEHVAASGQGGLRDLRPGAGSRAPGDRGSGCGRAPPRAAGRADVITVGEDRPGRQFWLARAAVAEARTGPAPPFSHRFVSTVHPADMPAVYRSAAILLLSSRAEGSPVVVEEALASG